MISHRGADNPLGPLKDDLLLALRRIQLNLDAYCEDPTESAPLETMIDAIDQIRAPLAALEHREAAALLEEMRATTLDLARKTPSPLNPAILRQATEQLTAYLENCLSPGNSRRPDAELPETTTTLRHARRRDARTTAGDGTSNGRVEPFSGPHSMQETLKRLRQIVADTLEGAPDHPKSWEAMRGELQTLHWLMKEQNWTRATQVFGRLNRIVEVLAEGAAEHYGLLVSGVCAEILAGLSYCPEPLDSGGPVPVAALSKAEQHLAQLDTLLDLPAMAETFPVRPLAGASRPEPTPARVADAATAMPFATTDVELAFPDWPDSPAPPLEQSGTTIPEDSIDIEWPESDIDSTPVAGTRAAPPAIAEASEPDLDLGLDLDLDLDLDIGLDLPEKPDLDLGPPEKPDLDLNLDLPEEDADTAATTTVNLVDLIGLTDADPEFVEVFLEEARGELDAIREQLTVWRADPHDRQALITIRRAFHTLKGSGRMVGATAIGDFAWEFESLLNRILDGSLSAIPAIADLVAAATAALAPLVGEISPRGGELDVLPALTARARALLRVTPEPVMATPPAPAMAPAIDLEFLEVFLEEARGELEVIREQLILWQRDPRDRQPLINIRGAFQTLKGSGRVVGATAIGDFAWCFENLLTQILNGTLEASPAINDLVGEAVTALAPLVGETPATAEAAAGLAPLTARIDELLREAMAGVAPVPTQPVEAAGIEAPAPVEPMEPVEAAGIEAPAPVGILLPMEAHPPEIAGPEPAALPEVDLELVRVFQYEAAEILDASDAILQQLSAEPAQPGLLNDLRRGMHTLKGSSRMAGVMAVGDLAHAAESVLDAIGKGIGRVTPVVLDTLQQALDRLNRMLAAAAGGMNPASATDLIGDLHRLAEVVATGEPAEELPLAAPAGIEEPAAVIPEPVSFQAMTELDQELMQVFQTEATEILDSSDVILQRLRDEPDSGELLNDLRREMHTLKGSSRMAGFMMVGDLAHAAESVLDALGKGVLKTSPLILDHVQHALDGLHQMLGTLVGGGQPPTHQDLIDELHGVLGGKPAERPKPVAPTVAVAPEARPTETPAARPPETPAATPADSIRVSAALLNTLVNQMGESSIFRARIDQGVGAMSFNLNELEQTIARLRRQVTNLATQAEARIQSRQDQGAKAHQLEFDPLELDRFTELQQVSRSLMEIADDLGNVGNTMSEHAREITTLLDQQAKVNKEIQQGLMRTGMVRFGSVIPRLRRVVRQASQELGKRAELLVGGEESEVDRTVLENMVAPLEHMLRNSLAHGIEAPEQRRAAGKSDIGTITLSLRREGAELVLELGDDGGGLNFDAIRAKGTEKGLLLPEQPATQEELIALLLRPGFSTASTVTQISGRGVGMDVVNAAIRAMRGALLIQTEPGQGTRFIVRLPFSLSVTQALLVQAGDATFAIPLLSIELVARLKESEFQAYLSGEQSQHQYSDRHYPVHNLGILIGSEHLLPFEEAKDRRPPVLLFRSAEASAALQVEAVQGNQEIIVKPVGPQFNGVPGISGATVLGDGRVVVVLELAALVRNIGSQRQKQTESRALRMARQEVRQERISIMVIDDSITMRKVTARILERHNIHAITAKDGLDAVAMLQTQVPDLAILDIEMPRMDGFEVVAHVRNQPYLRHLPVIMVTSRGGEKHRERAMKLGVNDYLTKPYQEEQLMQSIRKILGERALELIT
ncbi:MAG: Hpt domain-containing protein [Candidatus Competibacter sp.]|nr:Hpt domain-containing protein [Candidatus Competibacter sp.]